MNAANLAISGAVSTQSLAVSDKFITIKQPAGQSSLSGILIQELNVTVASCLVNPARNGWNLTSPFGVTIGLNQSLLTTDSVVHNSITATDRVTSNVIFTGGMFVAGAGNNGITASSDLNISTTTAGTKVKFGFTNGKSAAQSNNAEFYDNSTDRNVLLSTTSAGTSSGLNSVNVNTLLNVSGQINNTAALSSTPAIKTTGMIQTPYLLATSGVSKTKMISMYDGAGVSGDQLDHRFSGFGVSDNVLRYQTPGSTDNHIFYSAINATSSKTLATLRGDGSGLTVPGTVLTNKIG
jgi:hypothetical protein